MDVRLKDIADAIEGAKIHGRDDVVVSGIAYDSRQVKPGYLFAAVPGYRRDGREFISVALKNGAVAIISDRDEKLDVPVIVTSSPRRALADAAARFYDYPGRKLTICGVTGTNAKTTSVHLISQMLKASGVECGMVSSLVYDSGLMKYKAERTTPESSDMQRLLYEMYEATCSHGVVEVSSHALSLNRVDHIDFKVGLFTTFSRDHLDFHHTMDEYLAVKKTFLDRLAGDDKCAVLNLDTPEFAAFADDAKCPVLGYSIAGLDADVVAVDAVMRADVTEFNLRVRGKSYPVRLHLPGRYNLSNAVGSATAGLALGIGVDKIVSALEAATSVPGRFQPVVMGQPFAVILDYAHTPDAIIRLCQSAREITRGRLLILFGCGGDRDRGKRPMMGQAATENSDFVIVTSDNPRTEDPQRIIDDILPGMPGEHKKIILDRKEAIRELVRMARPDDTLLVAGKGAEDYQEIGTTREPFNDLDEVRAELTALGHKRKAVS